jgi:hypothetical protein
MTRANALSIQQPFAFSASGRSAVDRTAARGSNLNFALAGLVAAFALAYFAGYVATVLAVGAVERAEDAASRVAADLHDAERAAVRSGALSFVDASALGLSEVAPRFAVAAVAAPALSMNVR